MNIRRSISKRFNRIFGKRVKARVSNAIINLYKTDYSKHVLISYITAPFYSENGFTHQNYLTAHIIAESFSAMGYNVDVFDYKDPIEKRFDKYDVIFGFGEGLERSFYNSNRNIPRIYFVTGAHHYLHNAMSLRSVKDFYELSGLWLANEAHVLSDCSYYSLFNADFAIILANGFVLEDFQSRYDHKVYPLNNNIINAFSEFKPKEITSRNHNFLYLSGAKQITKGLHFVLELARIRKDLNFYIVVPVINEVLEECYKDVFQENVILHKNIKMNSDEMKQIVENCSYSLAPSYVDGMPGGTIEPMSAGLIPIVSKYCGFSRESFIFEMETLSVEGLHDKINEVLSLDDQTYKNYSDAVKSYACVRFSAAEIKKEFMGLLKAKNL